MDSGPKVFFEWHRTKHKFSMSIFIILITLLLATSSSALYVGTETGEINQKVVKPIKQTINDLGALVSMSLEDSLAPIAPVKLEVSPTPIQIRIQNQQQIRINTNPGGSNSSISIQITPLPTFDEAAFWRKAEEAKQKAREEYEARVNQMNEQYQQEVQKMNEDYQNRVEEMNKSTEEWKKEHGFE